MPTADHVGVSNILLIVKEGKKEQKIIKKIEILNSDNRSAQTIDGAWLGLYHWSEEEGKYWNLDIKKVNDDQWRISPLYVQIEYEYYCSAGGF